MCLEPNSLSSALACPLDLGARPTCRGLRAPLYANYQGLPQGVREPLVRRQGSQVSMRVARGSASWLSSHGSNSAGTLRSESETEKKP